MTVLRSNPMVGGGISRVIGQFHRYGRPRQNAFGDDCRSCKRERTIRLGEETAVDIM